jgi:hypothetical protein
MHHVLGAALVPLWCACVVCVHAWWCQRNLHTVQEPSSARKNEPPRHEIVFVALPDNVTELSSCATVVVRPCGGLRVIVTRLEVASMVLGCLIATLLSWLRILHNVAMLQDPPCLQLLTMFLVRLVAT